MNKLLRSPIAAKTQGVLLPGALQFARQTAKQLASELPRAVDARARPNGTGPTLQSAHPACEARRCTTLAIRLRIALDPTSLRFFMNNPYLGVCAVERLLDLKLLRLLNRFDDRAR